MDPCVLLDVDGVIADLVGELCARLGGFRPEHFTSYDFGEVLPRDALVKAWGVMRDEGFVLNLPAYEGTRSFIERLGAGRQVIAVTIPFDKSPTWSYERAQWLKRHGIDRVIHTAEKLLVRGDVLIEDDPRNLASWLKMWPDGRGILMDRPWNRDAFHAGEIGLTDAYIAGRVKRAVSFNHVIGILEGSA